MLPKDDVFSTRTLFSHTQTTTAGQKDRNRLSTINLEGHQVLAKWALEGRTRSPLRVLCVLMTYRPNHLLAMAAVELWGSRCTGVVAFSNETDWSIPVVRLVFAGDEQYGGIWNKYKAVYQETFRAYRHDFDYFFFGDDDTYAVVPNLFYYLQTNVHVLSRKKSGDGVYAGRSLWNDEYKLFYNTGAGFVLDGVALRSLATELETDWNAGHMADVYVADALRRQGILAMETRDSAGAHMFHHYNPSTVYCYVGDGGKADAGVGNYYKLLSHGFRPGREGCSEDTVVFHKIWSPEYMRVLDATLNECYSNTLLLRANLSAAEV